MTRALLMILCALTLPLAGCGVKGPLKRPSEIRQEQLKKQQEQQAPDGPL